MHLFFLDVHARFSARTFITFVNYIEIMSFRSAYIFSWAFVRKVETHSKNKLPNMFNVYHDCKLISSKALSQNLTMGKTEMFLHILLYAHFFSWMFTLDLVLNLHYLIFGQGKT